MPMKPEIANKLVQMGVPPERHDAASLAALFPPEFKVGEAALSDSEIAKVFITFVEHGLVRTPNPEARPPLHSHVCHFYRDDEEALSIAASFLDDGLRGGERCLWIPPTWIPLERARAAFRAVRPAVDEAEASGRLSFLDDRQVHLDESGAMRDGAGIIGFWLEQERQALANGFRGLRLAGDGTALVSTERWPAGVEYERGCDQAFLGHRISALCAYSVKDVPAARLAQVLSGHAVGVARASEGWSALRCGSGAEAAREMLRPD